MSTMTPMASVRRSATTMGAVRSAGTPCVFASTALLKTSPTLPRRDREHEAAQKDEQAVERADAADVEAPEVVLPLQEAQQIVRRRERERERKRAPAETFEARAEVADAGVEHEEAVHRDAEQHGDEQASDERRHRRGPFIACARGRRGARRRRRREPRPRRTPGPRVRAKRPERPRRRPLDHDALARARRGRDPDDHARWGQVREPLHARLTACNRRERIHVPWLSR